MPEAGIRVVAAACDQPSVGAERHTVGRAGVSLQDRHRATATGVPQPDGSILATDGHQPPIRAQAHSVHRTGLPRASVGVLVQTGGKRAAARLPQIDRTVKAAAYQQASIAAHRHADNHARVPLHRQHELAVRHPPQAHLTGGGPDRQIGAVGAERDAIGHRECLGQDRLGQVGPDQPGLLGLDLLQVCLADQQSGQIHVSQVAT